MLLSQTLRYLPAQLVGPFASFASVIVWTHLLPPAEYGAVALVLALQELVFQLCLSWWSHYVMRFTATLTEAERARSAAVENAVLLGSAVCQAATTWLALAAGATALSAGLVAASIAYTVGRCVATHLAERARAAGQIGAYTIAQTAGPLVGFALALALAVAHPTATAVLAGFALAQGAALPVLWWLLRLGRRFSLDAAVLRAALAYSLPLVLTGAIGWAVVNGVRVVVEQIEGPAAVGLLSVGWGLGQRALAVAAMLVTAAAFPLAVQRTARAGEAEGYAQVAQNGVLLLAVVAPSAAGIVCLTAPLVDLLIGPEFQAVTRVLLPVATLAAGIRNLRVHCADQVFLIARRPTLLLAVNAIEAVATLGACAVGLVAGGLLGACLGCLAGSALGFALCFGLALRQGLRVPLAPVLKVLAATGAMTVALILVPRPAGALALAAAILGAGTLYVAALSGLFAEHWLPAVLARIRRRGALARD